MGEQGRRRYAVLDGLRGVAAACVVLFHYGLLDDLWGAPSHAYLAVDLFFMLSGFVVATAYEARLKSGMGLGAFATARLIRLYPLHALGIVLGAGVFLARTSAHGAPTWGITATLLLLGLCFFPQLDQPHDDLFPLNGPTWSLMGELAANLAYAVAAPRLSDRTLRLVVLAAGGCLLLLGLTGRPLNGGAFQAGMEMGLVRVAFGFFLGVLIQRRLARSSAQPSQVPRWALLAIAAAALIAPVPFGWSGPYDAVVILGLFPWLVQAGARAAPSQRAERLLDALGRPSYPLYAVHVPLRAGALTLCGWLGAPALSWSAEGLAFNLGLTLLAAVALARWYDPWARAALGRWLTRPRPAVSESAPVAHWQARHSS